VTRPLTIVTVSTADRLGGAERVARRLHAGYAAMGDDAWMAVGTKRTNDARVVEIPNRARRSPWARALTRAAEAFPDRGAGFRVRRLLRDVIAEPSRWLARRRGLEDFEFPGTAAIAGLAGRAADALHLHNLHGGYFDLRALPALSAAAPTVITLHDAWMLSGHCAHSFDCARWSTGCGSCPALWIYPAAERDATAANWQRKREIFARSALYVATPCEWLAERVRRSVLMPAVRELKVIPYSVDLATFRPGDRGEAARTLGLDAARPVVVMLADAFAPMGWKDAAALTDALERLGADAATGAWQLRAIGKEQPPRRFGALTVTFVPRIEDDALMATWYRAADLYVHPARADTFPNAVLEAQACGAPVVATAVGGIPEQIEIAAGAETGVLVPGADGAALAAAIRQLAERPLAERNAMRARAVEHVDRRFGATREVERYREWLGALVERRASEKR
jgi:glycosyltransferase involved in cell wall biosynthesis